jgi:hypothetical protein
MDGMGVGRRGGALDDVGRRRGGVGEVEGGASGDVEGVVMIEEVAVAIHADIGRTFDLKQ